MAIVEIDSLDFPGVELFSSLTEKQLRHSYEKVLRNRWNNSMRNMDCWRMLSAGSFYVNIILTIV